MDYLLTYHTIASVHSARINVYGILTEYPIYVTMQRSVVHKVCIRKLHGHLFILKNIVSEKWGLEKSLSSLRHQGTVRIWQWTIFRIIEYRGPKEGLAAL